MEHFFHFLRGLAMGAANVIPGVSGGTIALLTGIFERLVKALRSFDVPAAQLLLQRKWPAFFRHTDFAFLVAIGLGVVVAIVGLAGFLEYQLKYNRELTMAFFFGLIVASVWFVGKTVRRWSFAPACFMAIGCAIAVGIALVNPAQENGSFFYLMLCGVAAICSMILPGLSGSFVLLVMGNYALVLRGIKEFDFGVLVPVAVGCGVGLLLFARLLSWLLKRFHDATIALLTGFVLGSLAIIWPWKHETMRLQHITGEEFKEVVVGYDWYLPDPTRLDFWTAVGLMVAGALIVWAMEKLAVKKPG